MAPKIENCYKNLIIYQNLQWNFKIHLQRCECDAQIATHGISSDITDWIGAEVCIKRLVRKRLAIFMMKLGYMGP